MLLRYYDVFDARSTRSKNQIRKPLKKSDLAPRARFKLATLRLTAETVKNLSALSGVAYKKSGAIFLILVAPNPAPKINSFTSPPVLFVSTTSVILPFGRGGLEPSELFSAAQFPHVGNAIKQDRAK